jgi:hypothetical protein
MSQGRAFMRLNGYRYRAINARQPPPQVSRSGLSSIDNIGSMIASFRFEIYRHRNISTLPRARAAASRR